MINFKTFLGNLESKKEGFVNQSMPDPAEEGAPKASEISADPYMSMDDRPPTPFSRRQENLKNKPKTKKKPIN